MGTTNISHGGRSLRLAALGVSAVLTDMQDLAELVGSVRQRTLLVDGILRALMRDLDAADTWLVFEAATELGDADARRRAPVLLEERGSPAEPEREEPEWVRPFEDPVTGTITACRTQADRVAKLGNAALLLLADGWAATDPPEGVTPAAYTAELASAVASSCMPASDREELPAIHRKPIPSWAESWDRRAETFAELLKLNGVDWPEDQARVQDEVGEWF